ncbi:bacterio-opsin activator domain-containing protein [Natronobeatus ordinarius]|uniref:bacterio-opsin activator domain-containing protein n=1 Tax=Natronobeatus ordinarius TaxID=2963433 RepID=UPI0020CDD30F|nr:bacterio-opsin activator domain-containing protein [Natronobeatus ordinarius]
MSTDEIPDRVETQDDTDESEGLDVLLVEDNPGDARLIEEMLRRTDELTQRVESAGVAGSKPTLVQASRLEAGIDHLESNSVDVVLLDLNLPDSTGLETLSRSLEVVEWTPVLVLTGVRDQDVGIEAIERGAQDYLVKGEVTDDLLIRSIHHSIERTRQERDRERRRKQLESLNRLNEISQTITHDVITTSTREELEQAVCDRLAESDSYRFAWIGQLQRGGNEILPSASAGVEAGYLEAVTITVDDEATGQGPSGRAVRTHEIQLAHDIQSDASFEPWRERALERGYRSSASVPILHDDLLYGVLNVYAGRPNAFTGSQLDVLDGLGDVVGHAIAAIERREALVSDTSLELEFQLEGVAEELAALSRDEGGHIHVDRILKRDGALLAYGVASELPREEFFERASQVEWIDDVRAITSGYGEYEFEARTTSGVSLVDALAGHGGQVTSTSIDDGDMRIVVDLPHGTDARRLIDVVEAECPAASFVAQRTADRSDDDRPEYDALLERELTEKQREALETAVFAGYFDWPRASTGEEVADRLGISPATFTQHLRAAERKFFDTVFDR